VSLVVLLLLQIFDFLDQDCLGSFNLVALMASTPEWLDDLDDEVNLIGRARTEGGCSMGQQSISVEANSPLATFVWLPFMCHVLEGSAC
jgi:hypothetical protein